MCNNHVSVSEILSEFLEVAIHNILHTRHIYPQSIFERRKKYGVTVFQSVHPLVNDYISNCIKAVKFHAQNNQLKKLIVCIHNGKVLESYNFDILTLKNSVGVGDDDDPMWVQLEQGLRDYCLRLSTATTYLNPLPENASFRLILNTTEYSIVDFNENPEHEEFPWVHTRDDEGQIPTPDLIPLNTITSKCMTVQAYIEKVCVPG